MNVRLQKPVSLAVSKIPDLGLSCSLPGCEQVRICFQRLLVAAQRRVGALRSCLSLQKTETKSQPVLLIRDIPVLARIRIRGSVPVPLTNGSGSDSSSGSGSWYFRQ